MPATELQKVKNNFAAAEYRRLSSNHPILMQIMRSEGLGNWREINEAGPKIRRLRRICSGWPKNISPRKPCGGDLHPQAGHGRRG